MKLSDLKTGMRVELRQFEGTYIVQIIDKEKSFIVNENEHATRLANFLENFKFYLKDGRALDIVKVYDMPHISKFLDFNAKGELLWSEKQEIEEIKSEQGEEIRMDAVEFLKTFREICTKYDANSCLGCPFESGETYCNMTGIAKKKL